MLLIVKIYSDITVLKCSCRLNWNSLVQYVTWTFQARHVLRKQLSPFTTQNCFSKSIANFVLVFVDLLSLSCNSWAISRSEQLANQTDDIFLKFQNSNTIEWTLELHGWHECVLHPFYYWPVNKFLIADRLPNMTFCEPARDTVLTNRQTEKLNLIWH
jgi:hypothetical protein